MYKYRSFIFFFKLTTSPKRKKKIKTKIKICFKFILLIYYKKACSSGVERTAHNGLVVGSNPTKPKIQLILINKLLCNFHQKPIKF